MTDPTAPTTALPLSPPTGAGEAGQAENSTSDPSTMPPAVTREPDTGRTFGWPPATPVAPQPGQLAQPAQPAQPAPPAALAPEPPRRSVRDLLVVATAAAVLASGGTWAVGSWTSRNNTTPAAVSTGGDRTVSTPSAAELAAAASQVTAAGWSTVAAAVAPSVVSIAVSSAQASGEGSGVIIDQAGHVLTNNHVVSGAGSGASLTVTLNDGRSYSATVVGTDPSTDLAVIKLTGAPSNLTPLAMGDSGTLRVGDPVMAVGNPLGLAGTVTTGIVSALDRPVTTSAVDSTPSNPYSRGPYGGSRNATSADTVVTNAIQTSAAINPGNSGGALVNAKGELVGINSAIAQLGGGTSQSGNIGIGFAIPVNEARSIASQLIASGSAQHAYLGVSTKDATVTVDGAGRMGAGITQISDGTPAQSAGLRVGDVILEVNGRRVESALSLIGRIRELSVGDKATLTVRRGDQSLQVPVTFAAKPA